MTRIYVLGFKFPPRFWIDGLSFDRFIWYPGVTNRFRKFPEAHIFETFFIEIFTQTFGIRPTPLSVS